MFVTEQQKRDQLAAEKAARVRAKRLSDELLQDARLRDLEALENLLPRIVPVFMAMANAREVRMTSVHLSHKGVIKLFLTTGRFSIARHVFEVGFSDDRSVSVLQPHSWYKKYGPEEALTQVLADELNMTTILSYDTRCMSPDYGMMPCVARDRFWPQTEEHSEEESSYEAIAS